MFSENSFSEKDSFSLDCLDEKLDSQQNTSGLLDLNELDVDLIDEFFKSSNHEEFYKNIEK
jgi:hypothetical protein